MTTINSMELNEKKKTKTKYLPFLSPFTRPALLSTEASTELFELQSLLDCGIPIRPLSANPNGSLCFSLFRRRDFSLCLLFLSTSNVSLAAMVIFCRPL